jgi:hypothetical protein
MELWYGAGRDPGLKLLQKREGYGSCSVGRLDRGRGQGQGQG